MNKRSRELLSRLITKAEYGKTFTIEQAADSFGVSVRTIRYDIDQINDYLKSLGLSPLKLGRKGMLNAPADLQKVKMSLSQNDFYAIRLSKEERICFEAIVLLMKPSYVTLNDLAEYLFVSRSTIIQDQADLREFFREHKIYLFSYSNKGLITEGEEVNRRRMLTKLIPKYKVIFGDTPVFFHLMEILEGVGSQYLEDQKVIDGILRYAENIHNVQFTDRAFHMLKMYLLFSLFRVRKECYAEEGERENKGKIDIARTIMGQYSKFSAGTLPDSEAILLSRLLSRVRYTKKMDESNEIVIIQVVTMNFINQISNELNVDLQKDYMFYENLAEHLSSTFAAIGDTSAVNEIVNEIVDQYPEIKYAARKYLYILEEYLGRKIQDSEFTYIVIHICAALERLKNKPVQYSVLLVCGSGIGTARMLQARLEKYFKLNIVDVIAAHAVMDFDLTNVDAVISTIALDKYDVKYIQVSPMMTDEDCLKVGSFLQKISPMEEFNNTSREEKASRDPAQILRKIRMTIRQRTGDASAIEEIQHLLDDYYNRSELMLDDLLIEEHIRFDVECQDWRSAIRESSRILLDKGFITERYIDGMIRNVDDNGPYIVLAPGFALAHEAIEKGAVYRGLSLSRLRKPVPFGKEEMDPVEWICVLSATDKDSHLKSMFQLVNLFYDAEYRPRLQSCQSPAEAAVLVSEYVEEKGHLV